MKSLSVGDFLKVLKGKNELSITVKGRRTGKEYTTPVWFVLEGNKLHLLPVSGSDTNWYINILKNPTMTLSAEGITVQVKAKPITESKLVKKTIDSFGVKYGKDQIKQWYTKLDVAVQIDM